MYWGGDVAWVTPEDLGRGKMREIRESFRTLTQAGLHSSSATVVPPGSVVISTRAPIGHIAIAEIALTTNQGCRALVPRGLIDSVFLYWCLRAANADLQALGQGTTFAELSMQRLASYKIPLPPLIEQRAIAAFLDRETARIDELVAKRQELIDCMRARRLALIQTLTRYGLSGTRTRYSGIPWIGEIVANWRVGSLKRIGSLQAGAAFPDAYQGTSHEALPYFKVGDLNNPGNEELLRYSNNTVSEEVARVLRSPALPAGTIVFPKIGAALLSNKRRMLGVRACMDQNLIGLTVRKGVARYYFYLLQTIDVARLSMPGPVPLLNEGDAARIEVPIPPEEEQDAIARHLDERLPVLDGVSAVEEGIIELLQERRQALITAAVTGQIDVR